jgi:hypothetical protein
MAGIKEDRDLLYEEEIRKELPEYLESGHFSQAVFEQHWLQRLRARTDVIKKPLIERIKTYLHDNDETTKWRRTDFDTLFQGAILEVPANRP